MATPRLSSPYRTLLPEGVVGFEVDPRAFSPDSLWEVERPFVEKGIDARRSEFAAGRACARAALEELGFAAAPIPVGEERSPVWPEGLVGSITHTEDYCAAALARRETCAGLGIDAEIVSRMGEPEARLILNDDERAWLESEQPEARQPLWALVFSAKESLYKAQYPLTRTRLFFRDVSVTVAKDEGTYRAKLHDSAAEAVTVLRNDEFEGRFRFDEGRVSTSLAIFS